MKHLKKIFENRSYQIMVHDSLLNPSSKDSNVFYKRSFDRYEYKVFLHLSGRQLYLVDSVIYELPDDVISQGLKRKKIVRNSVNYNCVYSIWANSSCQISATLNLKNGEEVKLIHYLNFPNQVKELSPDKFQEIK